MTAIAEVLQESIRHHVGAGCYIREAKIPAGYKVVKHTHSYDHFSILAAGTVCVVAGGIPECYSAPCCIKILAGIEHEITALDDTVWFCVHGTTEEIHDLDDVYVKGVE